MFLFLMYLAGVAATAKYVIFPYRFDMPPSPSVEELAKNIFRDKVKGHEGYRLDVYLDKLNILTVGIGHKVIPADNLKLGQIITHAQALAFFEADAAKALSAAIAQAREARKYTATFIAALAEVNFQLGVNWRAKFYNTWRAIVGGNVKEAVSRIQVSAWAKQTPVRVSSFINALKSEFA